MKCADCGGGCFRRECLPQFQEDRLRMWKNHATGDRFSMALGEQMPETRRELKRLERERGIEFVSSPRELSHDAQAALAYGEAIASGVDEATADAQTPLAPPPPIDASKYVERWWASNVPDNGVRMPED